MKEYKLTEAQVYEITSMLVDEISSVEDHLDCSNSTNTFFVTECQKRIDMLRAIIALFEV